VEDVVVEEVLEVVPLVEVLVVLEETEEPLDDDDDDDDEDEGEVDTVLETGDEVVEGTGVGDVGVLLVGEEGVAAEVPTEEVAVGTTLHSDVLAQKPGPTRQNVRWGHHYYWDTNEMDS
jgi:hypothetical protein